MLTIEPSMINEFELLMQFFLNTCPFLNLFWCPLLDTFHILFKEVFN